MGVREIVLGYTSRQECAYHPKIGMHIPAFMYRVLEGRDAPPFKLYAFLRETRPGQFPHVELFDEWGVQSDDFPFLEKPETIRVKSPKRIVLPKGFAQELNIEGMVVVLGNLQHFEIWNPEEWINFRAELPQKDYQKLCEALMDESNEAYERVKRELGYS